MTSRSLLEFGGLTKPIPERSNFQVIGLICCGQLFLQICFLIEDYPQPKSHGPGALSSFAKNSEILTSGEFLVVWDFWLFRMNSS